MVKLLFHPSWDGVLASLAIAALVGRSCAGCSVSQRGACTPLVSQGLPSGSSPAPAPGSLQEHRAHLNTVRSQSPRRRVVATQACVLERVFVRRQATAYLLACAHALTFWRLPVHTSRVCSVVNVNGDGGGCFYQARATRCCAEHSERIASACHQLVAA